jgi:thiol-disulfide isomerase/thioredoxin
MTVRTRAVARRIAASSRFIPTAVAAIALLAGTSLTVGAQGVGLPIGTTAPGAAVQSLDGKAVDLAQYVGKTPVVLEFWATWCPLCKKLEPALEIARQKYAGRVTFVSVGVNNNQTPEKQKAYAAEKQIGGEFVFDKDGNAVSAYKAPHTSYLVVIDAAGKVAYTGVGGDQDVAAAVAKGVGMMHEGK